MSYNAGTLRGTRWQSICIIFLSVLDLYVELVRLSWWMGTGKSHRRAWSLSRQRVVSACDGGTVLFLLWPWIVALSRRWYTPVIVMFMLIAGNEIVKVYAGYSFFLTGYSLPILIINSVSTAICLGCLAAYVLHRKRSFDMAWQVLGQGWSAPVFMAIMLLVCTIPNDAILHVFRMFYICVAMTLAVMACSIRGDHAYWFPALPTNRVAWYIGMMVMGMYLYHPFGINITDRFLHFRKRGRFCNSFALLEPRRGACFDKLLDV